jgi:hypothetical protein
LIGSLAAAKSKRGQGNDTLGQKQTPGMSGMSETLSHESVAPSSKPTHEAKINQRIQQNRTDDQSWKNVQTFTRRLMIASALINIGLIAASFAFPAVAPLLAPAFNALPWSAFCVGAGSLVVSAFKRNKLASEHEKLTKEITEIAPKQKPMKSTHGLSEPDVRQRVAQEVHHEATPVVAKGTTPSLEEIAHGAQPDVAASFPTMRHVDPLVQNLSGLKPKESKEEAGLTLHEPGRGHVHAPVLAE